MRLLHHEPLITMTHNDMKLRFQLSANYFPPNVGCDMTEEIALVKKKIYDIVVMKAETVYDPDSFREFFISTGATK